MADLADVQQAVFARQQIHQCAEVENFGDRAFVHFADFYVSGDHQNTALGFVGLGRIGAGNGDDAFVADIDLRASFFCQGANHCAAFADHVTNFLGVDLQGIQLRRKVTHFNVGHRHSGLHFVQNVHARFFGLGQCHLHDFFGDALDFDVHLQCSDTVGGASHFKVHVAKVVFVTQNVGKHGKFVAVFDEAHGNARHMRFEGHTCVHHGQAAAADRCHGARTIGLSDLTDHAQGVRKLFFAWQHGHESTLGQTSVADFAALRSAHTARFASGKRRHVVMENKAVLELAAERVDALRIALSAQCGHHQSLRFTACEQG